MRTLCIWIFSGLLAMAASTTITGKANISGNTVITTIVIPPSVDTIPTNLISGAFLWWHASDLAIGVTVSNQWYDRIQHIAMGNAEISKQPTNSINGVYFNGTSTYLSNAVGVFAPYPAGFLMIIKRDGDNSDPGGSHQQIEWDSDTGIFFDGFYMVPSDYEWRQGVFNTPITLTARIPNAKGIDMLFAPTNGIAHSAVAYTNGVSVGLGNEIGEAGNIVSWLGAGIQPGDSTHQANHYKGYLQDFIVWTNSITLSGVSNLHYYTTNLYNYSP